MKLFFCTLFDINYLSRGLSLFRSLNLHCDSFQLYVLCLDEATYNFFTTKYINKNIHPIKLEDIEREDQLLLEAKKNRNIIEYYFTLSPCLPLYILKKYNIDHITSLDADILFFSSPMSIFRNYENFSILITPHNFPADRCRLKRHGIFNVSFQSFKNDNIGLQCLEDWRIQCLEWCYDVLDEENGRYADQKYLDDWPSKYPKVKVLNEANLGLAPWNVDNYTIRVSKERNIFVDELPLIYFHFHGFRLVTTSVVFHKLKDYGVSNNWGVLKNTIYKKYYQELKESHILIGTIKNDKNIKRNKIKNNPIKQILNADSLFWYPGFNLSIELKVGNYYIPVRRKIKT